MDSAKWASRVLRKEIIRIHVSDFVTSWKETTAITLQLGSCSPQKCISLPTMRVIVFLDNSEQIPVILNKNNERTDYIFSSSS